MTLNELKEQIILTIRDLKDHGVFPKENHLYDYKKELNFFGINDALEIFMRNLAKDILSFLMEWRYYYFRYRGKYSHRKIK
ncbi:hypothetical protein ACIXQZ_06440 [Bacteroides fragilis]